MGAVGVVGAGAMGTWFAVRFSQSLDQGQEVILLARKDRAAALRENGVFVDVLPGVDPDAGDGRLEPGRNLRVVGHEREIPDDALVFFAVRAYQTAQAAQRLKDAGVHPGGVVTLQNGLGNAEALSQVFGEDVVAAGATSHGVTALHPTGVRHTGAGDTSLGPWVSAARPVAMEAARVMADAGIRTTLVDEPREVLWRKVAVNAAINPPTAIHRIENGRLLDGGPLERELREAAREVAQVARAEGIPLTAQEAEEDAVRVAQRTARNRSSMLQALEAGQPLETDAITGQVVKRARDHGIRVPVNTRHLQRLNGLVPEPRVVE